MRLFWTLAASLCLAMSAAAATAREAPAAQRSCEGSTEANRNIVLAFYNEALVELQPRSAFMRYMAPDFVEHKADVPDGTLEATATYLEDLIAKVPHARWEVLRSIAEGDFIFLHARFTPARGAEPYAIADIFRVRDCRIVEHWDVVAPPPSEHRNPNSRF